MPDSAYEERRKRIKGDVDRAPEPMAEIVRRIQDRIEDREYSYSYVRGVLSGAPGKTSKYVLDAVEKEVDRIENGQ